MQFINCQNRYRPKFSILLSCLFAALIIQSCSCTQKYNDLQHRYMEIHAEKQTEQDHYKRELKEKDDQIAELLRHIKNLETHIQKLENK